MRILHVDETFHPSYGYQCTPLAKFQSRAGHEVHVLAPVAEYMYPSYRASFGETGEHLNDDDTQYTNMTGVQIHRVGAKGRIFGRLNYDTKELYRQIDQIQPEVMLVHCLETLTAMRLIRKYSRRYPMVLDSHMLSMASKNRLAKVYEVFYRLFVTRIIKRQKLPVIKLQNDDYVTRHLGIPEKQTQFISFGTDTALFCEDDQKKTDFLQENNFPDNTFVVVSTGKMTQAKDGMLFARAVQHRFETERPVVVVVVANFDNEYEQQVLKTFQSSENNIVFYPTQKYLDLPFFYQIADVTVFPKQCSMSFYDAQSCGCPVISEKGKINEERNSHGNGLCFDCGDVEDLRSKIETLVNMPRAEYLQMRKNSREFIHTNYSYERIAGEYTKVLALQRENFCR